MINGDRIRQARELRGLTQTELSEYVGVNQSAIAQIESGRTQPSPHVLEAIAIRTGFPVAFFKKPPGPDFPLGSLLFRAHASMTAQQQVQAWRYAEIIHEATERMAERVETPRLRLPKLPPDPMAAARVTRSELGLSPDRPIPNLIRAIEKGGVLVIAVPVDLERRDAFSAWVGQDPSKPVIVVSGGRPGDRLRFNVSHELGHLVMHHVKYGEPREIERQANQFAAEFLMPEVGIRDQIPQPVTLTTIATLKQKWGVSIQALIKRARDLEIISQRQYHYLFEQLGARGWKKEEPKNLDISVEKPRAVRQIAEMLYGVPINYRKLAEDINLSPVFAREIIEAHAEKAPGIKPNPASGRGRTSKILIFPKKLRA